MQQLFVEEVKISNREGNILSIQFPNPLDIYK